MATTETWIYEDRTLGYTTLHATITTPDGNYAVCSGAGPLDKAVMVAQGGFRLFLDADAARALGAQMIAAAIHHEDQRREAQS